MSDIKITNASFSGKTNSSLPEGVKIIKENKDIRVEEIENGFIITKSYDINYEKRDGSTDYMYYSKKWFSKTNPIKIDHMEDSEEESLADKF